MRGCVNDARHEGLQLPQKWRPSRLQSPLQVVTWYGSVAFLSVLGPYRFRDGSINIVIGDMHAPSMSQIRANAYVGPTPQPPWRLRTKLEEGKVRKAMGI
jgi:hypothetical protein